MAQSLPDEFIRRSFYIIGLGNRLGDVFVNELNKSRMDSRAILLEMLPKIFATRPLTKNRAYLLEDLADLVAKSRGEYVTRFKIEFEAELESLVKGEYKKTNEAFNRIPLDDEPDEDPTSVIPFIIGAGIFAGLTVDQWFTSFREADRNRIHRGISSGVINGRTPEQIARDLLGTASQGGRNGILATSQNSARTLTRTITTGVSNLARSSWAIGHAKKKAVLQLLEVYSAILDSRTTFICASLSGNVYPVGQGFYPPMHPNCRSSRYPIPAVLSAPQKLQSAMSSKLRGKDFTKDARRRVGGLKWDKMSRAERSLEVTAEKSIWLKKNVGELPENLRFDEWFANQPQQFQYDYLGKTRYEGWKNGDISIDDFVSPIGRRYRITELEDRGIL